MTESTLPTRWDRLLKGALCYLVCLVMLVASALIVRDRQQLLATGLRAEGVVVGHPHGWAHPEVRFQLPGGEPVVFSQGGFHTGYALGETVSVRYLAERPLASAVVEDPMPLWGPLGLPLVMAVFFFCAGRRLWSARRTAMR